MSPTEAVIIALAGVAAGTINTVVGSGTLITFPTLLAFGIPPVTANVSNTIGLVPGSVAGAWGYRREMAGQRARLVRFSIAFVLGGSLGAALLLVLPPSVFAAVVPALIALALVLVIFQPRLSAWVARRHEHLGGLPEHGAWWVWPSMFGCAVYGGYFGAAQGILQMAIMGAGVPDDLQRLNAIKNVLAALVNAISGAIFIVVAVVDWRIVALIASGSVIGGLLGASVGRRLPPKVLRAVIVVVGVAALASFVKG
ncbi:sulfite exporter TauE/SafE family protein [Nocardioides limicola]|uniref:sulfite exporter TauE/SafE family protein n=1 Tax=Nocardioides limicola TaxID=2803368 RepID=UPI00193C0CB2|nr:sulfite exporter TauE/SafE family protein [Nocardioides sp. DJM-14]